MLSSFMDSLVIAIPDSECKTLRYGRTQRHLIMKASALAVLPRARTVASLADVLSGQIAIRILEHGYGMLDLQDRFGEREADRDLPSPCGPK